MAKELAFVLINPYSVRKSRTGGIMARYLVRTDLKLAGARMVGASTELVNTFAEYLESYDSSDPVKCSQFAAYVRRNYMPEKGSGRPHRSMLLLFEGEDAIQKIFNVTGSIRQQWCSGQSVRDTYGDLVVNPATGAVEYFEPAVLVGHNREIVGKTLNLWRGHLARDAGIIRGAMDVPDGKDVQETLVVLKPDNWHQPSLRAGNIVDLLSSSGLRIVGAKKFAMSVAQAEEFYGPVRENLRSIFKKFAADRAAQALSREFGFPVDAAPLDTLCDSLAPLFAQREFENIVEFMTGCRPGNCSTRQRTMPGTSESLALVYEGVDAVDKIRDILGATDPNKARPGSIRREFGTNIMINAAHASDSVENAQREMRIIEVAQDPHFEKLINSYY